MTDLRVARSSADLSDLARWGRMLAGGTDLLVQIRGGRREDRLVDVTNLNDAPPLVQPRESALELSALAPLQRIVHACGERLPALSASAAVFGSLQIRNRATIGGNLANASPAADTVPPLVTAGASVVLRGADGMREVALGSFFTGPGQTILREGEWISSVLVPLAQGEEGFRKVGGRQAMAISIVSLAWRWVREPNGTLSGVRLALGAVAPVVARAVEAEASLEGRRPDADVIERACRAIRESVSPIDDVRASAWYRREVAGNLLMEALAA